MIIKLQHANRTIRDNKMVPAGFYFEIQADGNHETLATSEIYNSRADALYAIGLIEMGAGAPDGFEVVDDGMIWFDLALCWLVGIALACYGVDTATDPFYSARTRATGVAGMVVGVSVFTAPIAIVMLSW